MKPIINERKGISLIVLIITIIVMIILATSIILVLSSSGIISNAQKSAFQSDIKTMEEELNVYLSTKYLETNGTYQKDSLNASKDTLEESGEVVEGKNIQDVITSMENKYLDKIVIRNGKIEYIGEKLKEIEWSNEVLLGITGINLNENTSKQNKFTLENCANTNLVNYRIYGDSLQSGTPTPDDSIEIQSVGDKTKNLIDYRQFKPYGSGTIVLLDNGIEYTGSYYVSIDGSHLVSGQTYTMSWNYESVDELLPFWRIKYTDNTYSTAVRSGVSTTIPTDKKVESLLIYPEITDTVHTTKLTNIQLEEGTTATNYEPYGYKIPITVSGKNLLKTNL